MGVALSCELRRPLAVVCPSDAIVELLEELGCGSDDHSCDLSKLSIVLLPTKVDVLADEALIKLGRLVSYFSKPSGTDHFTSLTGGSPSPAPSSPSSLSGVYLCVW